MQCAYLDAPSWKPASLILECSLQAEIRAWAASLCTASKGMYLTDCVFKVAIRFSLWLVEVTTKDQ